MEADMYQRKPPFKVLIMDDDNLALSMAVILLYRHLGTVVLAQAGTPDEVLRLIKEQIRPDVVVLDIEYQRPEPALVELVQAIRGIASRTSIVCLGQYVDPDNARAVLSAGVDGLLLKREIGFALASAILQVCQGEMVISSAYAGLVQVEFPHLLKRVRRLPNWEENPDLSSQVRKSFFLRVLAGMRAPLAAEELGVEPGTIEKYISYAYQILQSDWADETYLEGIDISRLSPEDQAFHRYTLLPRIGES